MKMKLLSIAVACLYLTFSILTFSLCALDKSAARHKRRRIPEKRFFVLAICGGGAGLWCGMLCFRHKTKHWYFWVLAVLTTLIQLSFLLWLALKVGGTI
ncbi:MAG: DUF1294 domain-containing protein [Candidatus Fimivivens sp.]